MSRRLRQTGTAEEQRKRHLQRQARQDALVRLRAGETVSIMAYTKEGYKRFTIAPFAPDEPFNNCQVLALVENKIWVVDYIEKDGCRVYGTGRAYHIPYDKLFGIVVKEGN